MDTSQNDKRDDKMTPPKSSTVILLLASIADTTWRMFGPTIGLTLVGVYVDKQLNTLPWFSLIGISLGAIIAALLIRSQLKKV